MANFQRVMQKYFVMLAFISVISLFVYSLSFFTPLAPFQHIVDHVEGSDILFDNKGVFQTFNRQILLLSIIGFVIILFFFVFFMGKRKYYYFSNYFFSIIYFGYTIYSFYYLIDNLPSLRKIFAALPIEQCESSESCLLKIEKIGISWSCFIFDLGIAIAALLLASGGFIIYNIIFKYINNKKDRKFKDELKMKLGVK